ncbi:hypothetical protein MKX01_008954, partial [Papaver californicum]
MEIDQSCWFENFLRRFGALLAEEPMKELNNRVDIFEKDLYKRAGVFDAKAITIGEAINSSVEIEVGSLGLTLLGVCSL